MLVLFSLYSICLHRSRACLLHTGNLQPLRAFIIQQLRAGSCLFLLTLIGWFCLWLSWLVPHALLALCPTLSWLVPLCICWFPFAVAFTILIVFVHLAVVSLMGLRIIVLICMLGTCRFRFFILCIDVRTRHPIVRLLA
jgi:hypothetical protein